MFDTAKILSHRWPSVKVAGNGDVEICIRKTCVGRFRKLIGITGYLFIVRRRDPRYSRNLIGCVSWRFFFDLTMVLITISIDIGEHIDTYESYIALRKNFIIQMLLTIVKKQRIRRRNTGKTGTK